MVAINIFNNGIINIIFTITIIITTIYSHAK